MLFAIQTIGLLGIVAVYNCSGKDKGFAAVIAFMLVDLVFRVAFAVVVVYFYFCIAVRTVGVVHGVVI